MRARETEGCLEFFFIQPRYQIGANEESRGGYSNKIYECSYFATLISVAKVELDSIIVQRQYLVCKDILQRFSLYYLVTLHFYTGFSFPSSFLLRLSWGGQTPTEQKGRSFTFIMPFEEKQIFFRNGGICKIHPHHTQKTPRENYIFFRIDWVEFSL